MKLEITGDSLHELMESLPSETQKAFQDVIMKAVSKAPIQHINRFIEHFNEKCPIDVLISKIAAEIIMNIGRAIWDEVKDVKAEGEASYTGKEATLCAIKQIREIADHLQSHIEDDHCCDMKH